MLRPAVSDALSGFFPKFNSFFFLNDMNSPRWFKTLALLVLGTAALSACAVSPDGPATGGASHGSLGSDDMSDYYYRKDAGWTYTYQNVQNIYNADGTIAQTLTGASDYVHTLGFDGYEPSTGDSMFRYEISYRVSTEYAGRPAMPIVYLPTTKTKVTHGAFVDFGANVLGMVMMQRRPRPVSTDTILAGIVGRIRTLADPFDNQSNYVWQKDTLWTTVHLDSVFIWERFNPGGPLKKSRCIFLKDFRNHLSWTYDLVNTPTTTKCIVEDPDAKMTIAGTFYDHVANFRIYTPEIDDNDFNRENKYFACGVGPVYQYDWWYTTSNGITFQKQDFTRSLITLTRDDGPVVQ
jgi:hypothetical protein